MKKTGDVKKENGKALSKVVVPIVTALIGAAALVIAAFVGYRALTFFKIDIRVYNEEGTPVEAQGRVTDGSEQAAMNRRTDREGRLELERLKNGPYTALVSADGYDPARAEFDQRDKQVNITI